MLSLNVNKLWRLFSPFVKLLGHLVLHSKQNWIWKFPCHSNHHFSERVLSPFYKLPSHLEEKDGKEIILDSSRLRFITTFALSKRKMAILKDLLLPPLFHFNLFYPKKSGVERQHFSSAQHHLEGWKTRPKKASSAWPWDATFWILVIN